MPVVSEPRLREALLDAVRVLGRATSEQVHEEAARNLPGPVSERRVMLALRDLHRQHLLGHMVVQQRRGRNNYNLWWVVP